MSVTVAESRRLTDIAIVPAVSVLGIEADVGALGYGRLAVLGKTERGYHSRLRPRGRGDGQLPIVLHVMAAPSTAGRLPAAPAARLWPVRLGYEP